MVGYHQTNQKTDTGKTLTRWPVLVDHNSTKQPGHSLQHCRLSGTVSADKYRQFFLEIYLDHLMPETTEIL